MNVVDSMFNMLALLMDYSLTGVLTRHGGVFTWGDGTYGQLGHNNTSNQLVPRKVFELMGITVRLLLTLLLDHS